MKQQVPSLAGRRVGWDARASARPTGGIAVAVGPGEERIERALEESAELLGDEPAARPPQWTPEWREALHRQVATVLAARQLPGAGFAALLVPRAIHGQSQGICDIFGARVEPQSDGNFFVYPLPSDPSCINALEPGPLHSSQYWAAVEWVRYARKATKGRFAFRNPVMTGPLDTANYLLGSTVLFEWLLTEPDTVHRLLDKITGVIIGMLTALKEAAGGVLHADLLGCTRNIFSLCSECRSVISAKHYEEFEGPYLRRIGERLGPYGIHSCGGWERTVPASVRDPNLRAMHGQVRENDLALLCELADGNVILSIGRSQNLDERYTWPDTKSFLAYVLETVPDWQPLETGIQESDMGLWNELYGMIHA